MYQINKKTQEKFPNSVLMTETDEDKVKYFSYDIRHVDRERRGGGVALIYKKDISFRNIVHTHEITQFELLDCIIKVNKLSTRLVVVYRPPPSRKHRLRYENFAIEWSSYIEQFVEVREELFTINCCRFQHSR